MYIKRALSVSAVVIAVITLTRWTSMGTHFNNVEVGHEGWLSNNFKQIAQRTGIASADEREVNRQNSSTSYDVQRSSNSSAGQQRTTPPLNRVPTGWFEENEEWPTRRRNIQSGELVPGASLGDGQPIMKESQIPEMKIGEALRRNLMTVVSGYVEMPGMPHHPASYFHRGIPGTLRWLKRHNANVVYYHNLDLSTHTLGKVFNESGVILRKVELEELPGASVSERFKQLCIRSEYIGKRGNKCKYLHERLNKPGSYHHVLSIWFSKLAFVDALVRENPFNSIYFAWLDCGILSRLGPGVERLKLPKHSVGTPRSGMQYGPKHKTVGHRMGLMAGPGHKIQQLYRLHSYKIQKIFKGNVPMCYDEEIVLAELLRDDNLKSETKGLVSYLKT